MNEELRQFVKEGWEYRNNAAAILMKKILIPISIFLILLLFFISKSEFSLEDYEQIKLGMTYSEVKKIVGKGIEVTRNVVDGRKSVFYRWQDRNVKEMFLYLEGDFKQSDDAMKVVGKTLHKLK